MKTNIYEIYTKNAETGEGGWNIKWVRSPPELIRTFPNFDCIITTNDILLNTGDLPGLIDWPGKLDDFSLSFLSSVLTSHNITFSETSEYIIAIGGKTVEELVVFGSTTKITVLTNLLESYRAQS